MDLFIVLHVILVMATELCVRVRHFKFNMVDLYRHSLLCSSVLREDTLSCCVIAYSSNSLPDLWSIGSVYLSLVSPAWHCVGVMFRNIIVAQYYLNHFPVWVGHHCPFNYSIIYEFLFEVVRLYPLSMVLFVCMQWAERALLTFGWDSILCTCVVLCLQGRFTVPLLESAQTRRVVVSHNVDKALKEG